MPEARGAQVVNMLRRQMNMKFNVSTWVSQLKVSARLGWTREIECDVRTKANGRVKREAT